MARVDSPVLCINDVLTPHLLTEVFSRVPWVDLFPCKNVCNLWLSCIDHNPAFVGGFLYQRVRELSNLNGDGDKQLIHAPWNNDQIVSLTPTYYWADASKFFLDFLPILEGLDLHDTSLTDIVLGSSNGLLLCTNDIGDGERYCICNPITKKWLDLPPFPPCSDNMSVKVGFVCDPFYNLNGDDGSVIMNSQFGVKVVRLDATRYNAGEDEDIHNVDVDVFSSQTGCWTATYRVPLPDHINCMFDILCGTMVPYNGKLYWIVQKGYDILVYDIEKNEFLMDRLDPPTDALRDDQKVMQYEGLSLCQGSLWVAQTLDTRLRVFVLAYGQWCLKHDVDVLDDMQCSWMAEDNVSMSTYLDPSFLSMHPSDPMVGYLFTDTMLIECDFRRRTARAVIDLGIGSYPRGELFYVLPIDLPLWPAPLPLI